MTEPHPPKIETFDVAAGTNTDPKGIVRSVERYQQEEFGLYMARPTPGREQFHYIESWLLPGLNLRVTDFWFNPGYERDQDFYLDVASIGREGSRWHSTDLYLDLVLRNGHGLEVIDTAELLDAREAGLLDEARAVAALETVYATIAALAAHQYDLGRWMQGLGIGLYWLRRPSRAA